MIVFDIQSCSVLTFVAKELTNRKNQQTVEFLLKL